VINIIMKTDRIDDIMSGDTIGLIIGIDTGAVLELMCGFIKYKGRLCW
jgi:hypothetical protein